MFRKTDSPGKQAVDRFLDINELDRQYEILRRLMVTSPEDEQRKDFKFTFQMALRKIASEGKQAEFWDMMNTVCKEVYSNPFDYEALLSAIESPSNVKQNVHCPKCGSLWRIRSEHAVAICKYGRCVKCLTDAKQLFDADAIRIYSYDVDRGMKSRRAVEAEQNEALRDLAGAADSRSKTAQQMDVIMKDWKKPTNVERERELQADRAAAHLGFAADELDAFREPEKEVRQRGPADAKDILSDARKVFKDWEQWLDVTEEAVRSAEVLMNNLGELVVSCESSNPTDKAPNTSDT